MNLHQRLNNPTVVAVFKRLLLTAALQDAQELMNNINKQAPNHARTPDLRNIFLSRTDV